MVPKKDLHQLKPTEKKGLAELILSWENYYRRQKIISVISPGEESFKENCKEVEEDPNNAAFIVLVPLSFLHLNDFKNNISAAATRFCFRKDGSVATESVVGLAYIDFKTALVEITKRVTGITPGPSPKQIVPEIPETGILTEEEEVRLHDKILLFKKTLNNWVDKLKKLPAVKEVELADSEDNPDRLILIRVKTSFVEDESYETFFLNQGNEVERPDWGYEGERSNLYEKWIEEVKEDTWEDVYKGLVDLSNQYTTVSET